MSELVYKPVRVLVSKEFTFDSAHNLLEYEGKCKHLHGHTYRVVYGVSSHLDNIGMAIDFNYIKDFHKQYIHEKLDHKYLNEVLSGINTTAENMAVWIYDQLESYLTSEGFKDRLEARVEFIRLYETPTSYAEARREWMQ